MNVEHTSLILEIVAKMGQLLLQNGAETYRVEDTMFYVARYFHLKKIHVFSVTNAIIFTAETADGHEHTRLVRVVKRGTNLRKVEQVNQLSREICGGQRSLSDIQNELKEIDSGGANYPNWVVFLLLSLSCGAFAIMFQGDWTEFIAATVAGGVGHFAFTHLSRLTTVRFFSEMASAFAVGLVAAGFVWSHAITSVDIVIVSAVMPLVPGRAITIAIRDLMSQDYISGVTILADATLTAMAIGIGIAGILSLL